MLAAVLLHAVVQWNALLFVGDAPFSHLRTYASPDQLGYMAISADVAHGNWARVEPYTETGLNTYPRLYYTLIGALAGLLHISPVLAWNLTGALLQSVMVGGLAALLVRLSGRRWAALGAPLAFLVGVGGWLVQGSWRITLEAHAVLWGPYGVLTILNAEAAGLSIGIGALILLAFAWLTPRTPRTRFLLTVAAAALVGVTANGQTYSFLMLVYLVGAIVSLHALISGRRWVLLGLTGALLAAMYALGPLAAGRLGQLPTLVLGLTPFLPGIAVIAVRHLRPTLATAGACAALAAPQILTTVRDLGSGDPFLTYRVASNKNLGVVFPETLVAMAPVAIPLLLLLVVTWRRDPKLAAASLAGLVVWPYGAANDVWGANAEPYRFWIDLLVVASVIVMIVLAALAGAPDGRPGTPDGGPAPRRPAPLRAVTAATLALYALTLPDYALWVTNPSMRATWNPHTPRAQAVAATASRADDGTSALLLPDRCLNSQTVKVTSGAPLAYYRLGMAWPADRAAVDRVMGQTRTKLTLAAAGEAGVRYVLADSACDQGWLADVRDHLDEVTSADYTPRPDLIEGAAPGASTAPADAPQRITLYRLR